MNSDKNKTPGKALLSLLKPNRGAFIVASLSVVMAVLLGFATPLLLAETIDCILSGKPSTLPVWFTDWLKSVGVTRDWILGNLWFLAVSLVALSLFKGVFSYFRGRMSAVASERIAKELRENLYGHLQALPFSYHVHAETGDLIQRCTSDVDTVRRFLAVQVLEVVNALLMIGIALVILLGRDPMLTLFSLILTPGIFAFAMWYFRKVRKSFQTADESEAAMSSVLQENLSGVRVVRAFGQQEREVERFDGASADFRKKSLRVNNLLAIYWGVGDGITMAQQTLTLLTCVVLAVRGDITVGTLVLFTSYVGQLLWPIRQLGRTLSDTGKSMVAMERIQTILNQPAEPEEPDALKPDLHGDIVFDHVSFAYPDDNVPVLKDISFTIPAGTTAAVLGATGSGKSTLMLLLQRLYEPTSGVITIGGVDILKIDRAWLRAHVGLILQEPFLYSRTIRENVGIALRDPEENSIRHAADTASATGFIERSEKGYDTLVGERGVTLSGGQKQRIAIARTLMKDNHILVFDDSLSAVDTETDARIRAALQREQKGVTTLIISHRVTTLSQADQILVLEDGRIADRGTHRELVARPGLYQRINNIQAGLEDELREADGEVSQP
ncbi:MAG: ABC transporter ATP-binding protein [Clostridia bacterium]|nr:ABC transporter ATP-binding protein [Clostridia bacterium]